MNNIKERITESASYYGLSMRKFERKCNLNRGVLSNMDENSTLGSDKLASIFDNCVEISLEWLLTGEGEMLRNPSKTSKKCMLCAEKDRHLKTKDKLIERLEQEIEKLSAEISEIKKYSGVPSAKIVSVAAVG